MERVYLGDWLYNAGIVGFLKINNHLWEIKGEKLISKDEDLLKFGENYIEFDRKIFEGFSKRFFDYAFKQYGRYENLLKQFEEYINDLKELESEENFEKLKNRYFKNKEIDFEKLKKELPVEIYDRFKKILQGFTLLKNKLDKTPSKNEIKKDKNKLIELLEKAIKIMKDEKEEFWESDVQIYLRGIYGQKSFLNRSINKDRFEKFYNDFEKQFLENKIQKDKIYLCISCMERKAKKNVIFDTGISKFYGLNPDAINFVWGFKPKLPLCEICEIIYFSYFAGLIPVKKDNKTVYYFVNSDTSVEDLIKENGRLEKILRTDLTENALLNFFTQVVLEASTQKARYFLQNIVVLEIDLTNETMPKVYAFNLSKRKAEFLRQEKIKDALNSLARKYYKIKDTKISILPETLNLILESELGFDYLNKLTKFFMAKENHSRAYDTNITTYNLQKLNFVISNFISKVIGGTDMQISEKEMWFVYKQGIDLANLLKSKNAENKIQSISYKLLNALRIGNTNQFMDILIRTYMAYGKEIPSVFVKTLSNKETFYTLGYSFLNGLLGKEHTEVENND